MAIPDDRVERIPVNDRNAEELRTDRRKLTIEEILAKVLAQPRIHLNPSSADIIRELRGPLPDEDVAGR